MRGYLGVIGLKGFMNNQGSSVQRMREIIDICLFLHKFIGGFVEN